MSNEGESKLKISRTRSKTADTHLVALAGL